MEALEQCAASEGGKQPIGNAVSISSGGAAVFLVAEEEPFVFWMVQADKLLRLPTRDVGVCGRPSTAVTPCTNRSPLSKKQTITWPAH